MGADADEIAITRNTSEGNNTVVNGMSLAEGDEVVILGRQGEEVLSADEMAANLDTINYEVVSTITSRVPRIYLR